MFCFKMHAPFSILLFGTVGFRSPSRALIMAVDTTCRMTDKDPAIEANWQAIGYTTRVRHTVSDLDSLKAYWFCVSAIGTAGEGAQSDPAKGIAA